MGGGGRDGETEADSALGPGILFWVEQSGKNLVAGPSALRPEFRFPSCASPRALPTLFPSVSRCLLQSALLWLLPPPAMLLLLHLFKLSFQCHLSIQACPDHPVGECSSLPLPIPLRCSIFSHNTHHLLIHYMIYLFVVFVAIVLVPFLECKLNYCRNSRHFCSLMFPKCQE